MIENHAVFAVPTLGNSRWFQGSRYSTLLTSDDTENAFTVAHMLQRQGAEPPPHVHRREHEIFLVLDTVTEFQAGAQTVVGQPGAVAFLPRGIAHRFAVTAPWANMLVIPLPGGFDRFLAPIAEPATHMDMPPQPGALDIPGLIARGAEFGIEFVPPGVALDDFANDQPEGLKPVVRQFADGETLDVLGLTVRVKLSAAESAGDASVFITEDPPRMGPPLHIHSREDETIYVIEGAYKVQVGDTLRDVKPGGIAYFPRGSAHTYVNAGTTTGKLLIMTTPGGYEDFFRDVDVLCKSGKATPEAFVPIAVNHGLEIVGPPIAV